MRTKPKPSAANAIVWREDWIPLNRINCHHPLQVRKRLDDGAIKRYRDMTLAGKTPPPIKVGRLPNGALYLVDGWHRVSAGALDTLGSIGDPEGPEVRVLLGDMPEAQARWEAASANMGHGVPLKGADMRNVFRAFVKAGMHRNQAGAYLSYREMAEHIGKSHNTIRNWMQADFRRVFNAIGGSENGNTDAGPPEANIVSLADEQTAIAIKFAKGLPATLESLSPEQRYDVIEEVKQALSRANGLKVERPPF